MQKRTYLDWAAAAPVLREARRSFERALAAYGNPSSPHEEGRKAKEILEDARTRIARLAGVKSESVIFTSGATEANALAIRGRVKKLREEGRASADIHILYSPLCHASVAETMRALREEGCRIEELPLHEGALDMRAFEKLLTDDTALVVLTLIESETGARTDTLRVRRLLDERRAVGKSVPSLHVDASQAPLVESFERTRLGADTLALDAQKVGAIRGIGTLILPPPFMLSPLIEGGGQERGFRPGTESPALAAAFAAALETVDRGRGAFVGRALRERSHVVAEITHALANVSLNEGSENAPHILNLSFVGRDTDYLLALLDEAGIAAGTKSACESDSPGSRSVRALTGDEARAVSTLRISWGPSTHSGELRSCVRALIRVVRFLDQNARK